MIAEIEVEHAIAKLNSAKSPGPDGFSVEVYKEYKNKITPVLTVVFNEAYKLNALPRSYGSSHTVLIPKTDDAQKLKLVTACRPIAITNVDCKIFLKIPARRLQMVIQNIIGSHQTCGIKGRTIFSNIHKERSLLERGDVTDGRVAILQIDLEKAFDCVKHEILFAVLDQVNLASVACEG